MASDRAGPNDWHEARRETYEAKHAAGQLKPQEAKPEAALFTTVNASYHVIPGKVDGIFAAALGVLVAGVAWANKRWKDKHHGDRPEG